MEKIFEFLRKNPYFILGFFLSVALLWPLFAAPYFNIQDDVQNIRLYEMNKCVMDFQLPCRWVPDLGGVYGYPLFNYYAPLPYYIGEVFYLVSGSLLFSTRVMFGLSFILSFIFMFLLGRKIWGDGGGLLSGVFYSYAPYHAVDFYVRGAMGEMWALAFFPAILWALLRLKEETNSGNLFLSAFFFACLILSHNLSAMLFLPVMVFLTLVFFRQKREKKFLGYFGLAVILGFLLSGFYFLPAYFEKPLVHLETTIEGYFSYTEHFKGLQKLFLERYWGYGPSLREIPGFQEDNTFPYQIGIIHWVIWLVVLVGALVFYKRNRFKSVLIFAFTLITIGAVFMVNPKSAFIWKLIPPLWYLQFPWRFLEIIIFFISLTAGGFLTVFRFKDRLSYILLGVLVISVVVLNFSYFRPDKFISESDASLLTGQKWDSQIKRSIFDYLPIYAKAPPAELAVARYEFVSGNGDVNNFTETTNSMSFNSTSDNSFIFRWSQYYFPNWRISIDGKDIPIDYNNPLGLITFQIPAGTHFISAHFYNTPVRVLGNLLTFLGVLISAGIFLKRRKLDG